MCKQFCQEVWLNAEMVEEEGVQVGEQRRGVCLSGDQSKLGAERREREGGDWVIKRSGRRDTRVKGISAQRLRCQGGREDRQRCGDVLRSPEGLQCHTFSLPALKNKNRKHKPLFMCVNVI